MTVAKNTWNVSFSRIEWTNNVLKSHKNVQAVSRSDDIMFRIQRKHGTELSLLCLDEYVFGMAAAYRAIAEFRPNIIFVGGTWNKYTREAKEYCIDSQIGLYNASEINGALWLDAYWSYHQKDKDGDPIYPFGVERQ